MTSKNLAEGIWIGAGARDGDRRHNMRSAVRELAGLGAAAIRTSSLYETEPVGLTGDRPLLNGVIEVAPGLSPRDLLAVCLAVERSLGRRREAGRDATRPIDLDILLYGERILQEPDLTVPHPRMHLRRFVLAPLAELSPGARHPILGRTAAELLEACPDAHRVVRWAGPEEWLVEVTRRFR